MWRWIKVYHAGPEKWFCEHPSCDADRHSPGWFFSTIHYFTKYSLRTPPLSIAIYNLPTRCPLSHSRNTTCPLAHIPIQSLPPPFELRKTPTTLGNTLAISNARPHRWEPWDGALAALWYLNHDLSIYLLLFTLGVSGLGWVLGASRLFQPSHSWSSLSSLGPCISNLLTASEPRFFLY